MSGNLAAASALEGTKGVPRNGGRKQQVVWSCFALNSLHVQTLMLTDAQTPLLVTPLVPLKSAPLEPWAGGDSNIIMIEM